MFIFSATTQPAINNVTNNMYIYNKAIVICKLAI